MVVDILLFCQEIMMIQLQWAVEKTPFFLGFTTRNGLDRCIIPYFIVNEIWYAFVFHICDYDNHAGGGGGR